MRRNRKVRRSATFPRCSDSSDQRETVSQIKVPCYSNGSHCQGIGLDSLVGVDVGDGSLKIFVQRSNRLVDPGVGLQLQRTSECTMRNLADTISRLKNHRERNFATGKPVNDRLVDLSQFGTNPGALRARVYLPPALRDGAPLVVALHGCTQTAAAYDHGSGWSRLADAHGFALLFPEQRRSNNAQLCFNWFQLEDTSRGSGEAHSIKQMIDTLVDRHPIARDRIFVTGLSAGGAMASSMLATYPDVFAGGAIIAGLPHGIAGSVPEAFDRMRGHGTPTAQQLQRAISEASSHTGPWPTVSVWHGEADSTVVPSNADRIIDQWKLAHAVFGSPRTETGDGHERTIWFDRQGNVVMEKHSIANMGHGTPLDVRTGLGNAGAYMLDAGVSSTLRIAGFWGLVNAEESYVQPHEPVATTPSRPSPQPTPPHDHGGIRKIIEDALRTAGLMR